MTPTTRNKRYYERRKRLGLCVRCGKPTDATTKCAKCRLVLASKAKYRLKEGRCIRIGCPNNKLPGKSICSKHYQYYSSYARNLKQKVLDHYGQMCSCPCGCRVTNFNWLTIDHKNNDGAKQRREASGNQYNRIIKSGYPDDIQILCWNCNCAKQYRGGCNA